MNQRLHRIHLKLPRYISESRLATVAVVLGKTHETQILKQCNAVSEDLHGGRDEGTTATFCFASLCFLFVSTDSIAHIR